MGKTAIGWTEETWNPVRGCSRVSAGCMGCYAEAMAARFSDPGFWGHGYAERTKAGPRWTGKVELIPEKLAEPLSWRTPRMCFVNSTSDLFHEKLPYEDIAAVYGIMAATPHVTYQVLTKRPERRREFHGWLATDGRRFLPMGEKQPAATLAWWLASRMTTAGVNWLWMPDQLQVSWPLPNVWEGTSVEDQATADRRIPELLQTPAAVRFVSYEPGLGPVNLTNYLPQTNKADCPPEMLPYYNSVCALHWLIVGGESGPNRRPFDVEWVRSTVEQCRAVGVACFVKQDAGPRPGTQGRIPDDLWTVKEFPKP